MPTDERVWSFPHRGSRRPRATSTASAHGRRRYRFQLLAPAEYQFRPAFRSRDRPELQATHPLRRAPLWDHLFHYRRGRAARRSGCNRSLGRHWRPHPRTGCRAPGTVPTRCLRDRDAPRTLRGGRNRGAGGRATLASSTTTERPSAASISASFTSSIWSAGVQPREDAIAEAGFAPLTKLVAEAAEFETWSQFVFNFLHS